MIIDLTKIDEKGISLDNTYSFGEEYIKNTPIEKLDNVKVTGKIFYDITREVVMDANISGSMVLLDAIDLEPIDYPFNLDVHEVISENNEDLEEYSLNSPNTLDIMGILWQNIVLEVPIRVLKDENKSVSLEGEGWELIDEDTKKVDPRLSPLAALLEKEGKE